MSRVNERKSKLTLAIVISLLLHALLFGLLIWVSLDERITLSAGGSPGAPINAVMVDTNQVVDHYKQQQTAAEKAAADKAAAEKAAADKAAAEKAAADKAAAEKAAADKAAAEKAAADKAAAEKAAADKAAAEKAAAEKAAAEKAAADKAAAEKAAADKAAAEKAVADKAAAEKAAAEKAAAEKAAADKVAAEKKAIAEKKAAAEKAAEKVAAEKAAAEQAAADKAVSEKAAAKRKAAADKAAAKKQEATVSDLLSSLSADPNTSNATGNQAQQGASDADIAAYESQIKSAIQSKFYDYKAYTGKECTLRIRLARDGLLLDVESEGGDPALCQVAESAARQAVMPKPPSDVIYEKFHNSLLDFKPGS